MMRLHRNLVFACLALCALTSFAAAQGQIRGRIYFVSGEELADAALVKQLDEVGGKDARRFVLALSEEASLPGVDHCLAPKSIASANDRELCAQIAAADVLVVRGGSFMQWYDTVYPKGPSTYLAGALLDHVRKYKTVIAHAGAGAFFSSGVSVPLKDLPNERQRNPRDVYDQKPRVAMGLGPPLLLDCETWPDGSAYRVLHAAWQTRVDLALHLVGELVVEYRREPGVFVLHGPGSALLFDLSHSRRRKRGVDEGRISLLHAGDGWDFVYDRAVPAPEGKPLGRELGKGDERFEVEAPLLRAPAWIERLAALAADDERRHHFTQGERLLELGWDEDSRGFEGREGLSLFALPFRCRWE